MSKKRIIALVVILIALIAGGVYWLLAIKGVSADVAVTSGRMVGRWDFDSKYVSNGVTKVINTAQENVGDGIFTSNMLTRDCIFDTRLAPSNMCGVFNGSSYVKILHNTSLEPEQFTIRVNAQAAELTSGPQWIFSKNGTTTDNGFIGMAIQKYSPQGFAPGNYYRVGAFMNIGGGADNLYLAWTYESQPKSIGYWGTYAMSYDGSKLRIYNGNVLNQEIAINKARKTSNGHLYLGRSTNTNKSSLFNGEIDNFEIYNSPTSIFRSAGNSGGTTTTGGTTAGN